MTIVLNRRWILGGSLLLIAGGLTVGALNGRSDWKTIGHSAKAGSGLVVAPSEVTVEGDSRNGHPSRVTFTMSNHGRHTVRIMSVDTTCGCTVAEALDVDRLTTGASTALIISATPPQFGNKETYVTVNTDDPNQPQLRIKLTLKGKEVKAPFITLAPTEVQLQSSRPGEILSRGVEVRTVEMRDSAPWLRREQPGPKGLKAFWVEPPVEIKYTDGDVIRVYYLHVEVAAPNSEDGPFRAFLDLQGNGPPTKPSGVIPVVAKLIPRIQAHPRELFFAVPASRVLPEERTVSFLEAERSESLRIWLDAPKADWVEVDEPEPVAEPSLVSVRSRVRVTALPPRATEGPGIQRTVIRFRTGDASQPSIEVPVTVRFN